MVYDNRMKNTSMKIILLLAVLAGGVSASDLPECVGDRFGDRWNNCFGTYTYDNGNKYVGEFKDFHFNGQGTYTSTDRTMREGIWQDGNFLGTVAEIERVSRVRQRKQDKYGRIYNACLLDKVSDEGTPVSSLEEGLKATCASIAEDPSFLESLRYN